MENGRQTKEKQFAEEVGIVFEQTGLPRMAGRILGWLLIAEPPHQSTEQLINALMASKGSISTDNCYPNVAVVSDAQAIYRDLPLNFFMDRYVESYIAEMKAFIACIQQDTEPPVTGRDGRIPVIMGYAARKSYKENRPVKLSEIAPIH